MLDKIKVETAVYNEDDSVLFLNKKTHYPLYEEKLENVEVIFHKEGFIEVNADVLVKGYWNPPLSGEYPDITLIEDKYKKDVRQLFSKKTKKKLKKGWYTYKKRKPFHLYSNKITIRKGSGEEYEL